MMNRMNLTIPTMKSVWIKLLYKIQELLKKKLLLKERKYFSFLFAQLLLVATAVFQSDYLSDRLCNVIKKGARHVAINYGVAYLIGNCQLSVWYHFKKTNTYYSTIRKSMNTLFQDFENTLYLFQGRGFLPNLHSLLSCCVAFSAFVWSHLVVWLIHVHKNCLCLLNCCSSWIEFNLRKYFKIVAVYMTIKLCAHWEIFCHINIRESGYEARMWGAKIATDFSQRNQS